VLQISKKHFAKFEACVNYGMYGAKCLISFVMTGIWAYRKKGVKKLR
jgi:hypothetical protein